MANTSGMYRDAQIHHSAWGLLTWWYVSYVSGEAVLLGSIKVYSITLILLKGSAYFLLKIYLVSNILLPS
jgi:hypothetical protein